MFKFNPVYLKYFWTCTKQKIIINELFRSVFHKSVKYSVNFILIAHLSKTNVSNAK